VLSKLDRGIPLAAVRATSGRLHVRIVRRVCDSEQKVPRA